MRKYMLLMWIVVGVMALLLGSCHKNQDQGTEMRISLTDSEFFHSQCQTSGDEAMSYYIRAYLKNYSGQPETVEAWEVRLYLDDVLLLTINDDNFHALGCGDQELLVDSPITTYGSISLQGLVSVALLSEYANRIEIYVTIGTGSGATYRISDIWEI